MNIFFLDRCPWKSAEYMTDKHVVKMVLESAQMLSTCLRIKNPDHNWDQLYNNYGFDSYRIYKSTHINHPMQLWIRNHNPGNLFWLTNHFYALLHEYKHRYDKVHKCSHMTSLKNNITNILRNSIWSGSNNPFSSPINQIFVPNNNIQIASIPPLCMPDDCKLKSKVDNFNQVIYCYRRYYIKHKSHIAKWTKRPVPYWWNNFERETAA